MFHVEHLFWFDHKKLPPHQQGQEHIILLSEHSDLACDLSRVRKYSKISIYVALYHIGCDESQLIIGTVSTLDIHQLAEHLGDRRLESLYILALEANVHGAVCILVAYNELFVLLGFIPVDAQ